MYDFYATPGLIKWKKITATIFLPRVRSGNGVGKAIKNIIIAAGFEIYDSEIQTVLYFHKNLRAQNLSSKWYE